MAGSRGSDRAHGVDPKLPGERAQRGRAGVVACLRDVHASTLGVRAARFDGRAWVGTSGTPEPSSTRRCRLVAPFGSATQSHSTVDAGGQEGCILVPNMVPDSADLTPARRPEPSRTWLYLGESERQGANHNPRVGGSSPSSGIEERPAHADLSAVSEAVALARVSRSRFSLCPSMCRFPPRPSRRLYAA